MSASLQPGEVFLDRYLIRKLIAEGGMASIYLAEDKRNHAPVAIKTLYEYYGENRVVKTRFIEEGRIQKFLQHPNIVHVYEVVGEPKLAIVMEYVDGFTLDDHLIEHGPMGEQKVLELILPVMSAIGFAHGKGIIHRDLKPSNILIEDINDDLVPKVMDFGVAKVKDGAHDLTATGTTVGTLHYMSPEQIVGSKNIDGRADIYSLGVTLYKLVTGEVPFNAPTEFALMMAQVEAPPLPPRELRGELSEQLEAIILKAMEKKPADRFQTIRELTSALLNMDVGRTPELAGDTITDRIPAEILEFAMNADEIATDRTGEMNFQPDVAGSETETAERDASTSTDDMSATVKIDRRGKPPDTDPTEELRRSQIIRLKEAAGPEIVDTKDATAEEHLDPQDSTVPIPSLQSRRERRLNDPATPERDSRGRENDLDATTRPSRPSARLENERGESKEGRSFAQSGRRESPRQSDGRQQQTADSGGRDEVEDEEETESMAQRVRAESMRGGVVVMDSDANSRDITAPKVSEEAYEKIMRGRAIDPDEQPGPSTQSPPGRNRQTPQSVPDADQRPSGPKVVIGKDYADTGDKTQERIQKAQRKAQRTRRPDFSTEPPEELGRKIASSSSSSRKNSQSPFDSSLEPLAPFESNGERSSPGSSSNDWKKPLLFVGLAAIFVAIAVVATLFIFVL